MNDAQYAAYGAYLHQLAGPLLLADWEITLKRAETTSDCYAQVWVMDTENHLFVRLDEGFWGGSAEDRREWLVHELVHAHLDRPERVMTQLAEQMDSYPEVKLAKALLHNEIEVCVQRLARIIAPTLPLPPEVHDDQSGAREPQRGRQDVFAAGEGGEREEGQRPPWRESKPEPASPSQQPAPTVDQTYDQLAAILRPRQVETVAAPPRDHGDAHAAGRDQCGGTAEGGGREGPAERQLPGG